MKSIDQKGISLIELVLALAAVVGLVTVISTLPSAVSSINFSRHSSIAKDIASMKLDGLRESGYSNLSDGNTNFTDPALAGLPSSTAYYEVSPCPPQICNLDEQIRKVSVVVGWTEGKNNPKVELDTLIGQGGVGQ